VIRDIFVSYKSEDRAIVTPLVEKLINRSFSVWYAEFDIKHQEDWLEAVQTNLKLAPIFLVFLSNKAAGSREVRSEISIAVEENKPIYVVSIDTEFKPEVLPTLGLHTKQVHHASAEAYEGLIKILFEERNKVSGKANVRDFLRALNQSAEIFGTQLSISGGDQLFGVLNLMLSNQNKKISYILLHHLHKNGGKLKEDLLSTVSKIMELLRPYVSAEEKTLVTVGDPIFTSLFLKKNLERPLDLGSYFLRRELKAEMKVIRGVMQELSQTASPNLEALLELRQERMLQTQENLKQKLKELDAQLESLHPGVLSAETIKENKITRIKINKNIRDLKGMIRTRKYSKQLCQRTRLVILFRCMIAIPLLFAGGVLPVNNWLFTMPVLSALLVLVYYFTKIEKMIVVSRYGFGTPVEVWENQVKKFEAQKAQFPVAAKEIKTFLQEQMLDNKAEMEVVRAGLVEKINEKHEEDLSAIAAIQSVIKYSRETELYLEGLISKYKKSLLYVEGNYLRSVIGLQILGHAVSRSANSFSDQEYAYLQAAFLTLDKIEKLVEV
jgi:hypothetical protein